MEIGFLIIALICLGVVVAMRRHRNDVPDVNEFPEDRRKQKVKE